MPTSNDALSLHSILHKLITSMRKHHHAFDKARENTGLGQSAHRMLMILSNSDTTLSQTSLAEKLEISTAAVAVTLKKMEADGYILRKANSSDSRFNAIELTDKGNEVVKISRRYFDLIDSAFFNGFSEEELKEFNGFVERIQANMRIFESEGGDFD